MKSKILLSLALILSGGLFCRFAAAQAPRKTAPPATKDAYIATQLAKLVAGTPAHIALRDAFYNWLNVDISVPYANEGPTNGMATILSVSLSAFNDEMVARDEIRQELTSFKEPVASTNAGYDEFFSGKEGEMIGRRGATVVLLRPGQPGQFDALFGAIAANLSSNPTLLPDLIHYAYTMHYGDPAPLRTVLSKLNDKVPELSEASFSTTSTFRADNAVLADYHTGSDDYELTIVAKAYDSEAAAKAGQTRDQRSIQAGGWNKKEIIRSVQVYEDTHYGTMYFQTGLYTFKLMATRYSPENSPENVPPLLLNAGLELITAFAPLAKQP
jgi:hypothetical protein